MMSPHLPDKPLFVSSKFLSKYIVRFLILIAAVIGVSADANAVTVDFTDNGTVVTPSLTEGGATVSGSNDLGVLNGGGVGIVGGVNNFTVDPGETMSFVFDIPVNNVVITDFQTNDTDGGGLALEATFEAFDENDVSLGSVTTAIDPNNPIDVSSILGVSSMSRFDITMTQDGLRIGDLSFDYASSICVDFTDNTSAVVPSLTEDSVTVSGSDNLVVLNGGGIGVFGGTNNTTIDPGETIRFSFDIPVNDVSISNFQTNDTDGGGLEIEAFFEAFDENGVSIAFGSAMIDPAYPIVVSGILGLGGSAMSAFDITMIQDGIRIASLCFDEVSDEPTVPVIFCEFESPRNKWLVKLPILVLVRLTDMDGEIVGKNDLPESANGKIKRPVTELTCGSKSKDNSMIFIPGSRRNPLNLWTTIISLGKKASEGTCSVDIFSGDEDAYTLDPVSCHTEYEAVKKLR